MSRQREQGSSSGVRAKRSRQVAGWLLALGGWLLAISTCVAAIIESRHYQIAAGALDDVLHAYALQSGTQFLYAPALTAHRRSEGLSGDYPAGAALHRLLRGSGLDAVEVAANTYVLKTAPPPSPPRPVPQVASAHAAAPVALAPVDVSGMHVRRIDLETATPLTVINREQIEHSGYQTLYDLLRAQPGIRVSNAPVAMTNGTVYQNNGLSGATGAASVDLRGLGSSATLFLIDGQRMAGYGLAQDDFSMVDDLNSIPLALIDHVDILRDGASAIYGADAMAGVINVVLRKSASGFSATSSYGASEHGDAAQHRFTASLGGPISAGGSALLSVDYLQRQPLLGDARGWNMPLHGQQAAPNGSSEPDDGQFFLDNASVRYDAGDCPPQQRSARGICIANAAALTNLQTGLLSRSLLGHLDQTVGSLHAYADLRWTQLTQRQQMAPAEESFVLPADHPDNTQHEDQVIYDYSLNQLGPVRDHTTTTSDYLTLGLKGALGEWDWDIHANEQHNSSVDRLDGLVRTDTFSEALGNGSFRLNRRNTQQVLSAISPTLVRRARSTQASVNAHVTGPLAQLPEGALSMTAGVEAYRNRLSDSPDPLLLSGEVFQFQTPGARSEDRWNSAAYVEFNAPLTHNLQAELGWRLDRSEGYGQALSPKLGLKWNLTDRFSLRGTLAKGYRAPTLLQLSRPPTLAAATGVVVQVPNTVLPCALSIPATEDSSFCELQLNSVSNPKLRPETSRSFTLGMVWAPINDLGIALDYYQIRRDNEITELPITYAMEYPQNYPQLFQRDSQGLLYALNQQLINLGHTDARTFDMDLHYSHETARYGRYAINLGVNYLMRLDRQVVADTPLLHYAGYASQPRWSALLGLEWNYRDWSTTANLRYTGHYRYADYADSFEFCPDYLEQDDKCSTPAFVLLDLNLAYAGIPHWTIALNVHNALDHQPVYYGTPGNAYNPMFDDVLGRSYLLSFTYRY